MLPADNKSSDLGRTNKHEQNPLDGHAGSDNDGGCGLDCPGSTLPLSQSTLLLAGNKIGQRLGSSIGVTDFTGDGIDDLILAWQEPAKAYVFAGPTDTTALELANALVTIDGNAIWPSNFIVKTGGDITSVDSITRERSR